MNTTESIKYGITLLTDNDIYLFKQGTHVRLYDKLGAHMLTIEDKSGVLFAVWAPNARYVSVIGDFNSWDADTHPLRIREDGSGIWEGFIPGLGQNITYKYRVVSRHHNYQADKGDPFAFCWEAPPKTASKVCALDYHWNDNAWMKRRSRDNSLNAPLSIYEMHLGSWRRMQEKADRLPTYRELAEWLPDYISNMAFTHVEFLPITEHPFYGSWGYQTTGYFAPTARYGSPQDFMYLVDCLHQRGVGVILDWVPSHFPDDVHGLRYFDGTHLFEHADPRQGYHPDWHSYIFNYGRHEVRSFLMSSALFWLDKYHVDSLRVDAVASMLYLDYGRQEGEWIPNKHGGNENLDAIGFLRSLNEAVYRDYPDVQTIAEESTAWPAVSRPTYLGGLGFGMKWNMGWMHDTLKYFSREPVFRKHHHDQLTFSLCYAFHENFLLPFSHDEVVHGKGSLIGKMPGDEWQKFANLRVLFGYMYGHPGKKLLFMGCEFAQWREWHHDHSLEWHLLQQAPHRGIHDWLRDLNHFYRSEPALYEQDFESEGFEWVDSHNWEESTLSFVRKAKRNNDIILVVCNFTPVPRINYHVGVPRGGWWCEALNSDAIIYGGSGYGNFGGVEAAPVNLHDRSHSLALNLPPLAVLFFKSEA
ncbi:1,4-alpha-glucan branching protein GlgB [Nitrosomonas aestuarii]|uniref:1,4-alpha-glucan branching protein GlgB n=1 Tax=Nitrosomonas aestuarii TaxID=52441 RepID=UPI000D328173|nr:1,4-alpha-glucan branching protein GlgB [Nitrosomonas aestuarii]PTN12391.1 1,4-alpha-glucan branching enzyme [Nitrosomonas aestuarii]